MKSNTQNMAKYTFILYSLLFFLSGNAQAPDRFSFQAVVRNTSNQLITNQLVGVKISLISVVMSSENAEFVETHSVTTNANGLFSLKVGGGTLVSGDFTTAMNSSAQSKKIKCEIDPTGGTNYTIVSNEQLVSVPYALKANNATFATTADTATNATTANSVVGIHGTEGYLSVFGSNNSIGSSILYEDSVAGNIGLYTQNPLVDLDVAGNGTILARKRVVLGPVGGNPATEPVWAIDNYNNEFRIFKQPNVFNSGNTYFSIAPTGNINMTNNLNVAGDISTNKITVGNNSSLGANSTVGNNFTISGSQIENITVLHLTGNSIIDYDISDTDRNIIVKHDDNIYGRYRINLPGNQPNGRILDVTLLFFPTDPFDTNRKYVEFTNLIPAKPISWRSESYMAIGNGISLGVKSSINDQETHSITHFKLIFSSELNSWIVVDNNYSSHTYN